MSEWIKVEDRLPEDNGYVLAVYDNHLPYITMFLDDGFGIEGLSEVTYPSHWMPLPEPPESL